MAEVDPDDELLGIKPPALVETETDDLGPAMRVCLPKEREFVLNMLAGMNKAQAARHAGYGLPHSTAETMAKTALRLSQRPRVVAALVEEAQKALRSMAPEAIGSLRELLTTFDPKAKLKAIEVILARTDPAVQRIDQNVKVEVVDRDAENLKALRAFKASGATRQFLEEWFGYSGLLRYEKMIAVEDAAQVIDVEYIEVKSND
ncbi:MAG: hypothetical protein J0H78_19005 [Rhizobiales bacterium]|nr:hypothetical protein [Hyphomicrobiales bacterium]OJY44276.1 MAG: hypothetical protein BGP08_08745 [Rhizobiales bacterium 64-17]